MPMKKSLLEAIAVRPLLGDGAMGTQLTLAGLGQGECGDEWNLSHPERVVAIQRRYVEAGSDCLLTNTFGASRLMLDRHGLGRRAAEINKAAVAVAREAFGDREGYVIGDIGPFGGFMEPYGDVPESLVRDAFSEQAQALVEAGVDAVIIETQTALEELVLGLEAAKAAGAACIIGSMAYDVGPGRETIATMMGVEPEQAAQAMKEHGANIVALNCGTGMTMDGARQVVLRYRQAADLPAMAQPNAGQPRVVGDQVVYEETPEHMAQGVVPLLEAGARIVGACCGSTPEHIRAFRAAIDGWRR
jgi:5-methyltetrahydrofolate--homocysteine methyltransferase